MDIYTPWGYADSIKNIGLGIQFVSTPSHGGYKVPVELLSKIDQKAFESKSWGAQRRAGWFEEDCDWAYVAKAFPDLFPSEAQQEADNVLAYFASINHQ